MSFAKVLRNDQDDKNATEAVKVPISDVLDLHTFLPHEIPSLLGEYLRACRESGIYSVRIVHGKGKGVLKKMVQGLLKKLPVVASFSDAPLPAGGWGATIVELRKEFDFDSPEWAEIVYKGARGLGVDVTPRQIRLFALHARELMAWNRFAGLTSITDPGEIAEKHFVDSLVPSPFIPVSSRVLDIGSGGGFPGIPLKIIRPDLQVRLIDASRKKTSFLKHIIRTLGLEGIEASHLRTEKLAKEIEGKGILHDVVVSRAVSKIGMLLDQAIPLVSKNGVIIAMKGVPIDPELKSATAKIKDEALALHTKDYHLPRCGIKRCLVVFSKKAT